MKSNLVCALLSGVLIGGGTAALQAQNPICPPGLNIADPTARVWSDGKLYVYGSRDESLKYYCSYDHWVLSTSDLVHWEYTPDVFASKGPKDQVPYNDDRLYAPDCIFRDGTYYLYYCQPAQIKDGVAVSPSPKGPFTDARPMNVGKYDQIDPAVFIDDDGQAYYLWGQFTAKIAKLDPNMIRIDPAAINPQVLTEEEHYFHEGVFMTKRQGIYYLVYACMERKGMPTCIGYATSRSPMGPFKYGGVIVDNDGCDPENWNNHGSIAEFKGRWYVFYHRTTHGCRNSRKACIEPIAFRADGSIPEVEMTSQGAGKPLDAFARIEAECACLLYGNVRIETWRLDPNNLVAPTNSDCLSQIRHGDKAAYKYIDFGKGIQKATVRVAPGDRPGKIGFMVDNLWGGSAGSLDIPGGGDGKTWTTLSCDLSRIEGVHALYLLFSADPGDMRTFSVDWITFGCDLPPATLSLDRGDE